MECLFYPALLCLVPYENNSILEIYWINHNRIEHTAEDTITQHHQGARGQLLLLVRNDSLWVSQRCLHVLGLDQIDWVCTFPLKLPLFFFLQSCQRLKIWVDQSKQLDKSLMLGQYIEKLNWNTSHAKECRISYLIVIQKPIFLIHISPFPLPLLHATTPVPAAAPALSVASFSESPPSGCGQYYSLPRKYGEIKGPFFLVEL